MYIRTLCVAVVTVRWSAPRPAKEVLLELYVKRSHWGETPPTATPTNQTPVPHFSTEAPPLTENIVQPNPVAPLRYNGTLPQQSVSIPYQSNSHSAFVQVSPVQAVVPVQAEAPPPSQYAEVERMLQSLECGELLGMFKTAMIRVRLVICHVTCLYSHVISCDLSV